MSNSWQNKALAKINGNKYSKEVTYHSTGTQVYDPATGQVYENGGLDYVIKVLFMDYTAFERKNTLLNATAKKAFIPYLSVSNPKAGDYMTETITGDVWAVNQTTIDLADALWTADCDKTSATAALPPLFGDGELQITDFTINYNQASPVNLINMPANTYIDRIVIDVITPFNGTIAIGTAADTEKYLATTDISAITKQNFIGIKERVVTQMILTYTAGTGNTAGQLTVTCISGIPL